jgi:hypothetical protein
LGCGWQCWLLLPLFLLLLMTMMVVLLFMLLLSLLRVLQLLKNPLSDHLGAAQHSARPALACTSPMQLKRHRIKGGTQPLQPLQELWRGIQH